MDEALIDEQAYLISRGVRPLALLESVPLEEAETTCILLNQKTARWGQAIPFVLPREDMGCAMTGFASAQWVIDLLAWSYDNAPLRQRHQILGLLLGYSPEMVAEHDAREFAGHPTALPTSK